METVPVQHQNGTVLVFSVSTRKIELYRDLNVSFQNKKRKIGALEVAEKAKANWAKKRWCKLKLKKSYARVRGELKECLTRNELTRKELFRACFSKDTGLQKMSKLQMQLMECDDDA
ncbi:hypothetical protein Tco_0715264 [Tanacetum coccineum]